MSGAGTRPPTAESAQNTFSDKITQDPKEHMMMMGSKNGQFTAAPPAQLRAFLDVSQGEENRLLAALWERILVPNPQDWTLAAFAREANERLTPTGVKHLSEATGIITSNVSSALNRLEAKGKIWTLTKPFRIYLCYNVPEPNNPKVASQGTTKGLAGANKERTKVICTDNFNSDQLRYLERLQQDSPETFRAGMEGFVATELYAEKNFADGAAWVRERKAEQWEQRFTEIEYTKQETRGRTRKPRGSSVEHFKPALTYAQFFVQNYEEIKQVAAPLSVQNGEVLLYRNENDSEQKPHPYGLTHHSLTEDQLASQKESDAKTKTPATNAEARQAELKRKAARTEMRTVITEHLQHARVTRLGAVKIDTGTISNMADLILEVDSHAVQKVILGTIQDRAEAIVSGKIKPEKGAAAYLYGVVKSEVNNYLRKSDLKEQISEAARGKSAWAKTKKAGA